MRPRSTVSFTAVAGDNDTCCFFNHRLTVCLAFYTRPIVWVRRKRRIDFLGSVCSMGFGAARWSRGWGGPMGCLAEVLDGRCHCIWWSSSWYLYLDVEECHQRCASEEIGTQEKEGKDDSS